MTWLNGEELDAFVKKWFKKRVGKTYGQTILGKQKNPMQIFSGIFACGANRANAIKEMKRKIVYYLIYSKRRSINHCGVRFNATSGFYEQTGRNPNIKDQVHIEYLAGRDFKVRLNENGYYEATMECRLVIDKLYDKETI